MTDPNKSTPSWNFGNAGTTANSSNVFGQAKPETSKPTSGLFGGGSNPPTPSGASLFGNPNTAGGSSLFGGTSDSSQAPAFGSGNGGGSGGGLFGGGNKQSGSLFGQSASQSNQSSNSTSTAPSGGFLGLSTPNKPADSTATSQGQTSNLFGGVTGGGSTGNLFGNLGSNTSSSAQTTPASKPTSNFFANSTTPAGPPPSSSAGPTGSGLFSKPATDGLSIFGQRSKPSTSQPAFQSGGGAPGGLNFGGTSKANETAAATSGMQPPSVFGTKPGTAGSSSGLFGNKADQGSGGLFQNLNKTQEPGADKPAASQQPQNEAPKAPSLFNLGGQSTATAANAQTASTSPFSFPSKPSQAQSSAPANPPTTSAPTSSGGFNLFNKPSSTAASTPSTSASMFPTIGKTQDKAPTSSASATASTTDPTSSAPTLSSSSFSNMGKSAPAPQTSNQATTTSTNLGASTSGPTPPSQSRLKNKSMDDIITRWATDLSKYQKEFQQQAEKVANWDRMLVENSEKIQKLYGNTLEAERATSEVERQLTAVENDQAELAHWLDYYEKEVDTMIASTFGQDGALSGPDQERERTYQLAAKLSERLDEMGKDLTSMIEEINDASSTLSQNNKADDPLSQVVRVLNGHLTQLQQIDQGAAALQLKVREAQRAGQSLGPSHSLSGPSSDAADGFYRSYMGRR